MKRFALLFCILNISVLYGQTNLGLYAGAGYGGILVSSSGIDNFISAYNSNPEWVTVKKMESPGMFSGVSFHIGAIMSNVIMEFSTFSSSSMISAEGDPNKMAFGALREIDIKYQGLKISLGWLIPVNGPLYVAPVLEMPIMKFKGETSTLYKKKYDFDIDDYFGISPGVMLVIGTPVESGAFFTARASYTFGLGQPDWGPLYYNTQALGVGVYSLEKGTFGGFTFLATLSASWGCL